MERKRVRGRFVRECAEGEDGVDVGVDARVEEKKAEVKPPRPRYCRTFTRARVAEALPDIIEKFAEEAKKGSIAHVKVLMKIGGLDTGEVTPKATKRRGKSVVQLLLENLKEDAEVGAEQAGAEQSAVEQSAAEQAGGGDVVVSEVSESPNGVGPA
ncbi:MAG: hypothetical protein ABI072_10175 [Edaphobacter sp.]